MYRPSTSITRYSLGLNASVHLSVVSCGILFHSSTVVSFKESRSVIVQSRYTFRSRSSHIPKSTGFKSGMFVGQ